MLRPFSMKWIWRKNIILHLLIFTKFSTHCDIIYLSFYEACINKLANKQQKIMIFHYESTQFQWILILWWCIRDGIIEQFILLNKIAEVQLLILD